MYTNSIEYCCGLDIMCEVWIARWFLLRPKQLEIRIGDLGDSLPTYADTLKGHSFPSTSNPYQMSNPMFLLNKSACFQAKTTKNSLFVGQIWCVRNAEFRLPVTKPIASVRVMCVKEQQLQNEYLVTPYYVWAFVSTNAVADKCFHSHKWIDSK